MPQVIIPSLIVALLAIMGTLIGFRINRKKTRQTLAGKKVMLFGPPLSGKTTFINWLIKGQPTEEYYAGGSGDFETLKDEENQTIYTFCDMGGGHGFLTGGVMEQKYKENDIILMFFNYAQYISDNAYKTDVEARFDALAFLHKQEQKPVLLIGSHWDVLNDSQQQNVKSCGVVSLVDSSKEYYRFLGGLKLILANLQEKKEVMRIWTEIRNLSL